MTYLRCHGQEAVAQSPVAPREGSSCRPLHGAGSRPPRSSYGCTWPLLRSLTPTAHVAGTTRKVQLSDQPLLRDLKTAQRIGLGVQGQDCAGLLKQLGPGTASQASGHRLAASWGGDSQAELRGWTQAGR